MAEVPSRVLESNSALDLRRAFHLNCWASDDTNRWQTCTEHIGECLRPEEREREPLALERAAAVLAGWRGREIGNYFSEGGLKGELVTELCSDEEALSRAREEYQLVVLGYVGADEPLPVPPPERCVLAADRVLADDPPRTAEEQADYDSHLGINALVEREAERAKRINDVCCRRRT